MTTMGYQTLVCVVCGHEQTAPRDPTGRVVCRNCAYHIIEPEPSELPEYQ